MGQWYSVYLENLKLKEGRLPELLAAVKNYVTGPDSNIWDAGRDSICSQTTMKGIVEDIYGPFNVIKYDDDRCWEDEENWHATFHGSYGWENVMYQNFKIMAPYLEAGACISCYPDEAGWHLVVQPDGSVAEEEEPEEEYED